jgi:hypothetical protein
VYSKVAVRDKRDRLVSQSTWSVQFQTPHDNSYVANRFLFCSPTQARARKRGGSKDDIVRVPRKGRTAMEIEMEACSFEKAGLTRLLFVLALFPWYIIKMVNLQLNLIVRTSAR